MSDDQGVDELLRQWTNERSTDTDLIEARDLAHAWLAESDTPPPGAMPAGIPGQRSGSDAKDAPAGGLFSVEVADRRYVAAMAERLP